MEPNRKVVLQTAQLAPSGAIEDVWHIGPMGLLSASDSVTISVKMFVT
jgi:hypothetical protein